MGLSRQASSDVSPRLIIIGLAGALTALGIGAYGKVHDPSGESIFTLFFTATLNMKAWLATAAAALGLFQLLSALRMYGKINIPRSTPSWLGTVHRVTGAAAFLLTIPVAYHCLWSLGFQQNGTRQTLHSLAGCFFYGAFVSKIVAVNSKKLPGWVLPVVGGTLFAALMVVWLTSALWFFRTVGFPEI